MHIHGDDISPSQSSIAGDFGSRAAMGGSSLCFLLNSDSPGKRLRKKEDLKITSLYYDVLKFIILLVVKSSQGAVDMARIISVCKCFAKFDKDEDILKSLDFDSVELSDRTESFQGTDSLIKKCAEAGNISAQYLLSKVILVSSSHLLKLLPNDDFIPMDEYINQANKTQIAEQDRSVSFLGHFMDNQSSTSHQSRGSLCQTKLVRSFLYRCNFADFISMFKHIKCYFRIFTPKASERVGMPSINDAVDEMLTIVTVVVNFGCKMGLKWSQEETGLVPTEFENELWNCLRSPYSLSALNVVHHEREVFRHKADQCVHVDLGKENEDAELEFADLGDYLFHHLVKKFFSGGAEASPHNILCNFGLDLGKQFCAGLARSFENGRINVIKVFDEVFPSK